MENKLSIRIPTVTVHLDIEPDNKKKIVVATPIVKPITHKKSYCFNFVNLFRKNKN